MRTSGPSDREEELRGGQWVSCWFPITAPRRRAFSGLRQFVQTESEAELEDVCELRSSVPLPTARPLTCDPSQVFKEELFWSRRVKSTSAFCRRRRWLSTRVAAVLHRAGTAWSAQRCHAAGQDLAHRVVQSAPKQRHPIMSFINGLLFCCDAGTCQLQFIVVV